MGIIILSILILAIGLFLLIFKVKGKKIIHKSVPISCIVLSLVIFITSFITTVPSGHVKVATIFGKVQEKTYREGLHFTNPLYKFVSFDLREKTHKETAGIPSEDKLITDMDVSVQYRTIGDMAPNILRNTGTTESLINVHMIPKLRSILREQGKGIEKSQDFFRESTQKQLQESLQIGLMGFLSDKGLKIESVLIRDVRLPDVIRRSIVETKRREQEVLKQQAELERFATEQDQKVKQAESEFKAAKLEAQKIKALADAKAYEIEQLNETLAKSPNYIELKKVEQWNGILPVYNGGNNMPILDLR